MDTSSSLVYRASRTKGGVDVIVKIQLADDCKNGHEDFSVTGEVYEAGKPRTGRNMISCGCVHEDVAKAFPEFKPFIRLHLADWTGIPMYAAANGFYHLKNGFNRMRPTNMAFPKEFCEYYRITEEQFDVLNTSEDQDVYKYHLHALGIFDQWKAEADTAISQLEKLTGRTFKSTAGVRNGERPTPELISLIEGRMKDGYYSPENIRAREDSKGAAEKAAALKKVKDAYEASCKKEYNGMTVKLAVINSDTPSGNFIYYHHDNTGTFNWNASSFNPAVTQQQFDRFLKWVEDNKPELPEGIKFTLK